MEAITLSRSTGLLLVLLRQKEDLCQENCGFLSPTYLMLTFVFYHPNRRGAELNRPKPKKSLGAMLLLKDRGLDAPAYQRRGPLLALHSESELHLRRLLEVAPSK